MNIELHLDCSSLIHANLKVHFFPILNLCLHCLKKQTPKFVILGPSHSMLPGRKQTAKVKLLLPTLVWKVMGLAIWKFSLEKMLGVLWVSCCIISGFFRKIKTNFGEKSKRDKLSKERLNIKVMPFVPLLSYTHEAQNFNSKFQTTIYSHLLFLWYCIRNCEEHCL